MPRNKKYTVLSGALLLALAGLAVKVIGVIYKIPLTSLIKSEGMGYFNSAYTVYAFLYMISSAGLPVAISLLVSRARSVGNVSRAKKIFSLSMLLFSAVGLLLSTLLYAFAEEFASFLGNPPAYLTIRAISPTLFLVSVMSVCRGYFQGHQYMLPTALSQLFEALGKLFFGMLLAKRALGAGLGYSGASAGAALGLTLGTLVAFVYLIFSSLFFKSERFYSEIYKNMPCGKKSEIIKSLISSAFPITVSASLSGMSSALDLALVMNVLQKNGLSFSAANEAYGIYSALAVPLYSMPMVLITPIAGSMVPHIAGLLSKGRKKEASNSLALSLRTTALVSCPCALGLCVFSLPILCLLFDDTLAISGAPLLSLLAPSVIFLSLATVTSSLLQSLGHSALPIISMLAGGALKLISTPYLIKHFEMRGTPIGTFLCYLVVCLMNFIFICRAVDEKINIFTLFAKPLIISCVSVGASFFAYTKLSAHVPSAISCLLSVSLAAALYFPLILLSGYIKKVDSGQWTVDSGQ